MLLRVTLFQNYTSRLIFAGGTRVDTIVNHHGEPKVKICIASKAEDLGCRTEDLSNENEPFLLSWQFSSGSVSKGESFRACVINMISDERSCKIGTNTADTPDTISLYVPYSSNDNGDGGFSPIGLILVVVIVIIIAVVLVYIIKKIRARNKLESSKEKE